VNITCTKHFNETCFYYLIYTIKDTNTGTTYDIRSGNIAEVLEQQAKELTQLGGKVQRPWEDWWQKKRDQNDKLLIVTDKSQIDIVRDLLNKAKYGDLIADINVKGLDELTPLHIVSAEGYIEIVMLLVKQ